MPEHLQSVLYSPAADLTARAHERCPYCDATRGNIDVELSVDGVLLPSQQSGPAAGRGEPA